MSKGSNRRPQKVDNETFSHNWDRAFNRNKLYGRRWREARATFLAKHPLCVMCKGEGRITPATELDHIQKHGGSEELFWDVHNWQGLCADHHRSTKAQMDRGGKVRGNGADGLPIDPNHNWKN